MMFKNFLFALFIFYISMDLLFSQTQVVVENRKIKFNGTEFFPFGWHGAQYQAEYTNFTDDLDALLKLQSYGVFNAVQPDYYQFQSTNKESDLDQYLNILKDNSFKFKLIIDTPRKDVFKILKFTKDYNWKGLGFNCSWGRTDSDKISEPIPFKGWGLKIETTDTITFSVSPLPLEGNYLSFHFGELSAGSSNLECVKITYNTKSGKKGSINYYFNQGTNSNSGLNLEIHVDPSSIINGDIHITGTKSGATIGSIDNANWKIFHRNFVEDFQSIYGTSETIEKITSIKLKGNNYWVSDAYVLQLEHYISNILVNNYINNPSRKNHIKLLGWYGFDEPDSYEYGLNLIWYKHRYQPDSTMKFPDIYPTYMRSKVIPEIHDSIAYNDNNHPNFLTIYGKYNEFAKREDNNINCNVLFIDKYDITKELGHFSAALVRSSKICKQLTEGILGRPPILNQDQALIAMFQGHGEKTWNNSGAPQIGGNRIDPYEAEYRYLIFSAIINGARGIFFWTFYLSNDTILKRIQVIGNEIFDNNLDQIILKGIDRTYWVSCNYDGHDETAVNSNRGPTWGGYGLDDINYKLFEDPNNSNVFYLFVSNDADLVSDIRDIVFTFNNSKLRKGIVDVLVYNKYTDTTYTNLSTRPKVKLENSRIVDKLNAWDIRVYKIRVTDIQDEIIVVSDPNGNSYGADQIDVMDKNLDTIDRLYFDWYPPETNPYYEELTSGDFNGDGVDEIAVATESDYIRIWETYSGDEDYLSDIRPGDIYNSDNSTFDIINIDAGDFDNDGADELIVNYDTTPNSLYGGNEFKIFKFDSQLNKFVSKIHWEWTNEDGVQPDVQKLAIGDFDGDGDDEVAMYSESNYVRIENFQNFNNTTWGHYYLFGIAPYEIVSNCTIENISAGDFYTESNNKEELAINFKYNSDGDNVKIYQYDNGTNKICLNPNDFDVSPGNDPPMKFMRSGNFITNSDIPRSEFITINRWHWLYLCVLESKSNLTTIKYYKLEPDYDLITLVTSGDYDGDGIDEIAYVVDDNNNSYLRVREVYEPTPNLLVSDTQYSNSIINIGTGNNYYLANSLTNNFTGINKNSKISYNFELIQNYPNPFNPETIIEYSLKYATNVKLIIYNSNGQKIRTLVSSYQNPGIYKIKWDGTDQSGKGVPSGIYFYKIITKNFSNVKKMLLIR